MPAKKKNVLVSVVQKLLSQLLGSLVVILLLYGFGVSLQCISALKREQNQSLDAAGQSSAKYLAQLVRAALDFDELAVENAAVELQKSVSMTRNIHPDFHYAAVVDSSGKVLAAEPARYIPSAEFSHPAKLRDKQDVEIDGKPIRHYVAQVEGSSVDVRYYVYMGFDKSRILQAIDSTRNATILFGLLALLLGSLSAGWVGKIIIRQADKTGEKMEETDKTIAKVVQNLRASASQIVAVAKQTQTQSADEAAAVEETKLTMEALLDSSNQIAEGAMKVLDIAERNAKASSNIALCITNLNDQATKITTISETIRSIADKSDILALNASLEGTKAGEVGRGFMLLGVEMRRLAETIMGAVREVKQLAIDIQSLSHAAVMATEEGQRLSSQTTEHTRQITLIAGQQRTGTQQVVASMDEIQNYTKQALEGAKEAVATADNLVQTSAELSKMLESDSIPLEQHPG